MFGYVFSWETCDFELKPPIIRWEKSMKLVSFRREPMLFMWLLMMAKETKQVGIHGKTDLAWFGHVPRKSGSRNNARDPTWRHVDGSQPFWIFLASFFALASDSPTPPEWPKSTSEMLQVGVTAAICAQLILDSPSGHFGFGVQRPLRHLTSGFGWKEAIAGMENWKMGIWMKCDLWWHAILCGNFGGW